MNRAVPGTFDPQRQMENTHSPTSYTALTGEGWERVAEGSRGRGGWRRLVCWERLGEGAG